MIPHATPDRSGQVGLPPRAWHYRVDAFAEKPAAASSGWHVHRMQHRLTKIVATLGPSCSSPAQLQEMIRAGVNCFRLNFSHGTLEEHRRACRRIRVAQRRVGVPVAILADLQGPKLRVRELPTPRTLAAGDAHANRPARLTWRIRRFGPGARYVHRSNAVQLSPQILPR